MKKIIFLFIALFYFVPLHAIEVIDILGGKANELSVAVIPFQDDLIENEKNQIHNVIKSDLSRSGFFRVIDTGGVNKLPTSVNDVDYSFWSGLQAELLVIGRVQRSDEQIKVVYELIDVFKEKMMVSSEYSGNTKQDRQIGHQISNVIYEKITGSQGVFHTKIGFVQKINNNKYHLNISDMDGFNKKAIVTSTQPIISTRWSPDGEKIAYVSFEKKKPVIYVQNLRNGERKLVANFKGNNSAPAWSPDSKQLAIVLTYNAFSQIYVMDADGKNIKRLMRSRSIDTEPTWAPDGKSIYFVSDRGGGPQIYKIDLATEQIRRVTFEGKYNVSPQLSPDGKLLTFITNDNGSFKVGVQNLISNQVMKLTQGRNDEAPVFSPNGHMVLYTHKDSEKETTLSTVSLNGFKQQVINLDSLKNYEATWSPIDF